MSPVSAAGVVRFGDRVVTIAKLSVEEEVGLTDLLAKKALAACGPGGHFANMRSAFEFLAREKMFAVLEVAVKETTRLQATQEPLSDQANYEYRVSPAGVVEELFQRTRATDPTVTRDELAAAVNEVNVSGVVAQIRAVLTDGGKA